MAPHTFIPDTRPYPADFLEWVAGLKFKRFRRRPTPEKPYFFEFNSGVQMPGHLSGNVYYSTFHLYPSTVLDSVNWRRLVAAHIRICRFACRRQARPASIIGMKPPKLPYPP
ncbi:hypothetical protein D9M73_50920 [compost metagenome]